MTAATAPCCNAGRRIVVFVLVHLSAHYLPISIRSARLARLWPTMVTRSVDGCSGTRDISVVARHRHRRSLARSLSDYPSDEWTTQRREGDPENRSTDFSWSRFSGCTRSSPTTQRLIALIREAGRKAEGEREGRNKKGKGPAAMCCHAMPVAAGPIHRSHRPLPNLRTPRKCGGQ